MKYHLYDENYNHKGDFQNLQEMRNYLCVSGNMTMMIGHICTIHSIISNLSNGIGILRNRHNSGKT